jgi:hypothetical protein
LPVLVSVCGYTTVPPGATWPLLFGVSVALSVCAAVTVTASVFVSETITPVEATAVDCTWK